METMEAVWHNRHVTGLRRLFYLVTPNETSFPTMDMVPKYVDEAAPYFVTTVFLEFIILLARGKTTLRFNDGFNSIAHGLISTFHGLLFRSTEIAAYAWFHERFCLYQLPWDSPWVWLLCMLGADFGYYWVHRTGHEVNIMWAGHQTHHSSEDYNLSTALRQSALHRYLLWFFYLPMALFVPPSLFLVHNQFNLLYQFWIHTECVRSMGPLELVLNTPSHHRVHHGRNPYCVDKNYAGVLIVWDRMFGTFQAEEETVIYGLVHPLQTWDPVYGQLCQLIHIVTTAWGMDGWRNKLCVFFCGPGWAPGKPRLGLREDLPAISFPVEKYDSTLPWWGSVYIWTHFLLLIVANSAIALIKNTLGPAVCILYILFSLFTLTSFGALYDNRPFAPAMEFLRCVVCLAAAQLYRPMEMQLTAQSAAYGLYFVSALFWGGVTLSNLRLRVHKNKAQ